MLLGISPELGGGIPYDNRPFTEKKLVPTSSNLSTGGPSRIHALAPMPKPPSHALAWTTAPICFMPICLITRIWGMNYSHVVVLFLVLGSFVLHPAGVFLRQDQIQPFFWTWKMPFGPNFEARRTVTASTNCKRRVGGEIQKQTARQPSINR